MFQGFSISIPALSLGTDFQLLAGSSVDVRRISTVFDNNNDPAGLATVTYPDYGMLDLQLVTGSITRRVYETNPTVNGVTVIGVNPGAAIQVIVIYLDHIVRA